MARRDDSREPRGPLATWAAFLHRRGAWVLVASALVVAAMGVYGAGAFSTLALPKFEDPASESAVAAERLQEAAGYDVEPGLVVEARSDGLVTRPAARAEVARLARELRDLPGVRRVATPEQDPALLSSGGRAALIVANLRTTSEDGNREAVERIREEVSSTTLDLRFGGSTVAFIDTAETAESDLVRAELIAFPLLALLLVVVFRGLVAALLPLTLGVVAVIASFAGLRAFNEVTPISITSLNLVTALGLGLAVDYALFLVSRYREEIEERGPGVDALTITLRTAGRTVIFSAVTVAAALVALCLFPQRFLFSMGLGGTFVTLFAALAALVVVPAMLAVLGARVDALSLRRRPGRGHRGGWYRIATFVQRRPIPVALITALVLLAAGSLALDMRTTGIDATVLPRDVETRKVDLAFDDRFDRNTDAPVLLAVTARDTPAGTRRIARLRDEAADLPGTRSVLPPQRLDRDTVLLSVISRTAPLSQRAGEHVEALRDIDGHGERFVVGGQGAELVDFRASVLDRLPLVLGVLLATTAIALFLLTGSIVLPLKSILMNGLTLAATAGFLVFVFQDGRLTGLLGYEQPTGVELSSALLVGALAFGLSTDYGVFLLARIKELRESGLEDREAIAEATQRTGGLITAAAALFVVAVGALTTSSLVFLKEVGAATAFAVIVDATLVRVFLVPSLMRLLGRANWWAPAPLRRFQQRLGLSE